MVASDTDPSLQPWLVADLGGTNVRFALAEPQRPGVLVDDSIRAFKVDAFDSLAQAALHYGQAIGGLPRQAVIAAAGPVDELGVQLTNHRWLLRRQALQADLNLSRLALVNDFAALAACVPLLAADQVRVLPGPPPAAPAPAAARMHLVMGPGTGLGVAGLRLQGGRALVLQTEAGHAGMAPTDELEIDLLQRLARRFGRVSHERLLCGPGLQNLHAALCERASLAPAEAPTPEAIVGHALDGSDPLCVLAVERFCLLLAGVAGDLALSLGAWDGVYFAGNLVQSLRPWLEAPAFRLRFEAKGRLQATVQRVPLLQILHAEAGLLGAAAWARDLAQTA